MNTLLERITIDPEVCGGRPCIKGTRIWVSLVLDFLADGMRVCDEMQRTLQALMQMRLEVLHALRPRSVVKHDAVSAFLTFARACARHLGKEARAGVKAQ